MFLAPQAQRRRQAGGFEFRRQIISTAPFAQKVLPQKDMQQRNQIEATRGELPVAVG